MYTVEAGLADTVDSLKEKLIKADAEHEMDKFKQIRLVHMIV